MPWAEQLPSGHWRACWRAHDRKVRTTTKDPRTGRPLDRKPQALRVAGENEAKARRGDAPAVGRTPTWADWAPVWQAARAVEPSTAAINDYRVRKYLEPQWGRTKLHRITRSEVQAWANSLAKAGLAPATVEAIFRLFQSSMTAAVAHEKVPVHANPCTGVKLPTVTPGHERFLTRPEVDSIAEHLNWPYNLAVWTLAGTGMRWGELAGLHWQRIDLAQGLIDIVETWDPTARRVKGYPKGKNRRAVPVPSWLAPRLEQAQDRAVPDVTCGQVHATGSARCRSGLVLPGPQGGPLNGKNFGRRQWTDACLAVGIDPPRLHDLRHTYASWLVQGGVPLQEVQRLLGHASIRTSERYAHLGISQHARVLAVLG